MCLNLFLGESLNSGFYFGSYMCFKLVLRWTLSCIFWWLAQFCCICIDCRPVITVLCSWVLTFSCPPFPLPDHERSRDREFPWFWFHQLRFFWRIWCGYRGIIHLWLTLLSPWNGFVIEKYSRIITFHDDDDASTCNWCLSMTMRNITRYWSMFLHRFNFKFPFLKWLSFEIFLVTHLSNTENTDVHKIKY